MNMIRSRSVVTLDYRSASVHWTHGAGVELKADFGSGRVLIDCGIGGRPFRLVLDSGAVGGIVLFRKPVGWVRHSAAVLTTAAGQSQVGLSVLPEVRVGTLRLRDVTAALAPSGQPHEQGCDGLLPSSLFQRVTIDFQQSRVFVEGK
jgi:predicted aspartyl protease